MRGDKIGMGGRPIRGESMNCQWCSFGKDPLRDCVECCCCSVAKLCLTLFDLMECSTPAPQGQRDFPGKNTGVGYHFLLQGIFPSQGWNPSLLLGRKILYPWATWEAPVWNAIVENKTNKQTNKQKLICDENVICLPCPIWQPLAICEYCALELRLVWLRH